MVAMSNIGHLPADSSTRPPLELLMLALRARPETVAELAAITRDDPALLRERLAELTEDDLLTLDGDAIGYRPPAEAITALGIRMLADAERDLGAYLSRVGALMRALPSLVASDALGASDRSDLAGEIFHGPAAAHELWRRLVLQQSERRSACMFPHAEYLLRADTELSDMWRAAIDTSDIQVRAIVSIDDMVRPESRAMLELASASGVEFRAMRRPPSWFWLTDEAVGLPLQWGDPWPTSAIAIRHEAVVSLMHGLHEMWWTRAATLQSRAHPWDAMLTLMADGATLETAAHASGVSSRTGRRRIEAAMDHYGVDGAVALGAAWQRERSLTSG